MRSKVPVLFAVVTLAVGGTALVGCNKEEEKRNASRQPSNTETAENTPNNVAREKTQEREEAQAAASRVGGAESTGTAGAASKPATRPANQ